MAKFLIAYFASAGIGAVLVATVDVLLVPSTDAAPERFLIDAFFALIWMLGLGSPIALALTLLLLWSGRKLPPVSWFAASVGAGVIWLILLVKGDLRGVSLEAAVLLTPWLVFGAFLYGARARYTRAPVA